MNGRVLDSKKQAPETGWKAKETIFKEPGEPIKGAKGARQKTRDTNLLAMG